MKNILKPATFAILIISSLLFSQILYRLLEIGISFYLFNIICVASAVIGFTIVEEKLWELRLSPIVLSFCLRKFIVSLLEVERIGSNNNRSLLGIYHYYDKEEFLSRRKIFLCLFYFNFPIKNARTFSIRREEPLEHFLIKSQENEKSK